MADDGGCAFSCRPSPVVCQNHRSCRFTVSPGRTGQLTGTVMRSCSPLTKRVTMTVWRKARGAKPPAIATAVSTGHVRDIGVLARLGDLAEDEERAIGLDLDRDVRLADVTLAQLVGYPARKLVGRRPARQHRADERHGDVAARVDSVGIGQSLLAEHDDAEPVAGVQSVGALIDERRIGHGGRDSDGA